MKPITIVDAPSNLGLRPLRPGHEPGVWRSPQSLREHGLAQRIEASDGGAIERPLYSADENRETGFRNGPALARFSAALAGRIGELIDQLRPFVREEDVVALGFFDDPADHESFAIEKFYESKIERFDAGHLRKTGARETAESALCLLERDSLDGFWIHLDVDVLHQSVMPAVDSPNSGGLTFAELIALLQPLVRSPHAVGMELTIFDPEKDTRTHWSPLSPQPSTANE